MSRREELVVASTDDELPVEVRDLLAELENDRGVQLALEVPAERAPARTKAQAVKLFKQIVRREKQYFGGSEYE